MPYELLEGNVPQEQTEEEETQTESTPNFTHGTRLWALLSIIFSAVGIALIFIPIIGLFFGLFGVALAVFSRIKNGYFYRLAILGVILGVLSLASCAFFTVYNAMTEAGIVINPFSGYWS